MKYDEASYLLKEIFNEVRESYPDIELDRYRDGGSIAFSIPPTEKYREIVLIAPVSNVYNKDHTKVEYREINHVDIMVPGCIKFEDIYKKENAMKVVMLTGIVGFQIDKEQVKEDIKNALLNRLKINQK